ncbi:MAG: iron ABC transporter permease [Verrucomicrobiota bacterium]|nr:iron ABC transporter permease [Verrucomicrobiota bacterium]
MKRLTGNLTIGSGTILFIIVSFLAVFLIYPLFYVFKEAFWMEGNFTIRYFTGLFSSPYQIGCIINTFKVSLAVTGLTILIALPLAHIFTRYDFPGKSIYSMFLLVPLILPPFVGAIGLKQVFSRFGSLNLLLDEAGLVPLTHSIDWLGGSGFWGVVIMQVLHLYPILYLNVAAVMANLDPSLREAAENLGSDAKTVFLKITMPLVMPGIFAGATIVFISAFTDLGTPLIFNYRQMIPVQIFDKISDAAVDPSGYALIVFVLILTSCLFVVSKKLFGGQGNATLAKGHVHFTESRVSGVKAFGLYAFITGIIVISIMPHLIVVVFSLSDKWFFTILPSEWTGQHYRDIFTMPLTVGSIKNSLLYSALSAFVDLILGVTIAWLVTRKQFAGRDWLDALAMLPLALPGLVLAFGYVMSFNVKIAWLNPRDNPLLLLVVAYSIRRLPFIVRSAVAGFQQTSVTLEEASQNLGAGVITTLRKITIPLVFANLIAGTILTFSFAMLEVGDSLILAMTGDSYPITKAIYTLMGRINVEAPAIASAMGVVGMLILGFCLFIATRILGKKMGEMFRM